MPKLPNVGPASRKGVDFVFGRFRQPVCDEPVDVPPTKPKPGATKVLKAAGFVVSDTETIRVDGKIDVEKSRRNTRWAAGVSGYAVVPTAELSAPLVVFDPALAVAFSFVLSGSPYLALALVRLKDAVRTAGCTNSDESQQSARACARLLLQGALNCVPFLGFIKGGTAVTVQRRRLRQYAKSTVSGAEAALQNADQTHRSS